jgi:hypothetical protein
MELGVKTECLYHRSQESELVRGPPLLGELLSNEHSELCLPMHSRLGRK